MDLPPVGLGTMAIENHETITTAIDLGYRHLDTAQIYDNEGVVGNAIAASGVDREVLTVATKVWADSLSTDDIVSTTETSMDHSALIELISSISIVRSIPTIHKRHWQRSTDFTNRGQSAALD